MADKLGNESGDSWNMKETEKLPTTEEISGQETFGFEPMADKMQNESGDSSNVKETEKLLKNEEILAQKIRNNCAIRSVGLGVLGGSFGFLMDSFHASMENRVNERTVRQQFIYQKRRGWSLAKEFAILCSVFSATECVVEKVRGKHDTTTTAVAGCVGGAAALANGGPRAACLGCAGYAAILVTVEKITGGHKPTTQ